VESKTSVEGNRKISNIIKYQSKLLRRLNNKQIKIQEQEYSSFVPEKPILKKKQML
jgi:hypothetical protein